MKTSDTRLTRSAIAFLLTFSLANLLNAFAFAQSPPNLSRWTGRTAQSQAQGFSQGDPLRLTWGFAQEGMNIPGDPDFPSGANNIRAFFNGIYGANSQTSTWQPLFQQTFDRWAELSGLEYSFEANDDGAAVTSNFSNGNAGVLRTRADVRISAKRLDGNFGTLAYNYFPNFADMVIDSSDRIFSELAGNSLTLRNTVAHEHGHGLGLEHVDPSNGRSLMEPFDSDLYDGPQHHDILVVQRGYGDMYEKSNNQLGNDSFSRATDLGTIDGAGIISIGDSARTFKVAPTASDFVSIDDSTDTDFFSFTINQASMADISLDAEGFDYLIGPEGGQPQNFNSKARSDLALALLDSNGTSVLQSSNASGLGGSESITAFSLAAPGTYYLRVTGADNPDFSQLDTQFYSLQLGIAGVAGAVPEPSTLTFCGLIGVAAASRRRRYNPTC